jgi:integrase
MAGRVFLRGSTYWLAFSHKGKEYRKSAKTDKKREAEGVLSHYLGQCARNEFHGFEDHRLSYSVTEMLQDLIADYEQRGVWDIKNAQYRCGRISAYFKDKPVENLTERDIDLYIKDRLKAGIKRTTINRYTQLLGQAMKIAHRKKLIKEIPYIEHFSEKDNVRQGFFERHELEAILSFMPAYWHDVVRFAYCTGWRKVEVLTLQWRDVQGDTIRLRPEIAKNKEGRVIVMTGPLEEVAEIIRRRQAARVDLIPWVFHRNGKQLRDYNKSWRKARKLAGLPEKIFHDTRRTAARNLEKAGISRQVSKMIRVWLFFDDVHLKISKCGARLGRCVWSA